MYAVWRGVCDFSTIMDARYLDTAFFELESISMALVVYERLLAMGFVVSECTSLIAGGVCVCGLAYGMCSLTLEIAVHEHHDFFLLSFSLGLQPPFRARDCSAAPSAYPVRCLFPRLPMTGCRIPCRFLGFLILDSLARLLCGARDCSALRLSPPPLTLRYCQPCRTALSR